MTPTELENLSELVRRRIPLSPKELEALIADSEELSRVKAERDALQAVNDDHNRAIASANHSWRDYQTKAESTLTEAQAKLAAMEGEREDFRSQLLRLINASASLTSSCPEFPPTSKPHTAVAFCKSEIERAVRVVGGKQPTKVDEEEMTRLERDKERLQDRLDLTVDEFIRIKALTNNEEIIGLCERAVKDIKQHVPVIQQRDDALKELALIRPDKERLDWLEQQEKRQMVENKNETDFLVWYPWMQTHWGKTYREAIDTAQASREGESR